MAEVTIKYGVGNSVTKNYETVEDAKRDKALANFLGYDIERVSFKINGQDAEGYLRDGETINVVTKANEKA